MKYFKDYFLFNIDKDEKQKIRHRIMHDDHKAYSILLLIIALFQAFMLGSSLITDKIDFSNVRVTGLQCLYLSLMILCLIAYFCIKLIYKADNVKLYFITVSAMMFFILLWGVGISLLDSFSHSNLTTFAYVTVSVVVFMVLEPWKTTLHLAFVTIVLNVLMAVIPETKNAFGSFVIINSLSVFALSALAANFDFYRRIKKIKLELEISDLNKTLMVQASNDALTNLHNRRYLTERINDSLNIGDKSSGVMIFDIDHFKKVNDKYGHQNGDICLIEISNIIKAIVTNNDDYIVRYGGEEFLVYFNRITEEELFNIAETFRKCVEEYKINFPSGETISISVSCGLALATHNVNYTGLIGHADEALYEAKKTRNVSFMYDNNK